MTVMAVFYSGGIDPAWLAAAVGWLPTVIFSPVKPSMRATKLSAPFSPPKNDAICDRCGHQVIQRADDTPEAIERRLSLYEQQTAPLLNYFRAKGLLKTVDGNREVDAVSADTVRIIEETATSNA